MQSEAMRRSGAIRPSRRERDATVTVDVERDRSVTLDGSRQESDEEERRL